MTKFLNPLLLLLFIAAWTVSCSESPQNAPGVGEAPVKGKVDVASDKYLVSLDEVVDPEGQQALGIDELKLENLSKPIVYGVGAAGITMDTTFDESKKLLTPPFRGPFSDGVTFYDEQVVVIWQTEGDRKPVLIIPMKGYLGKIEAGKFGNLDFQTKFKEYKGANPLEGATRLTKELYVELEGVADKNYDCIAGGNCQLIYGTPNQANMVLIFPGAVFLIAKEEFQMAEIRIRREINPGILRNSIDLLTGNTLVPDEDPISLGQTNEEVFARVNDFKEKNGITTDPQNFLDPDTIYYSWTGVVSGYHRTNYNNDVVLAEPTDKFRFHQVTGTYPGYFTIGGKRILMTQSSDSVGFSLEESPDPKTAMFDDLSLGEDLTESKLKMTTAIYSQNAMAFSEAFADFLKAELSKVYDVVQIKRSGYQNPKVTLKDISTMVRAYDQKTFKGVSLGFQVSQEQKRLNFFTISLVSQSVNPFNMLTLGASQEELKLLTSIQKVVNKNTEKEVINPKTGRPVKKAQKEKDYRSLAGVKLNDLIKLTNVDALGRQEATIHYLQNPSLNIVERGTYVEEGVFKTPVDERPKSRNQGFVTVGIDGTKLGIKVIGADQSGQYARVVSVSTGNIYGKISDVCGLASNLDIRIGMSDTDVENQLLGAIETLRARNPDYKCNYFVDRGSNSQGKIRKIYFEDEKLILEFSERALLAATIYLPFEKINRAVPGGAQ